MMSLKKEFQKVAIQGYEGAFHHIAAQNYANQIGVGIDIISNNTFAELVQKVENSEADWGLMAIENAIAGSLLLNYQLLERSSLVVCGEMYLRIKQNLMVLPGVRIDEIEEVWSHPIALAQCGVFFSQYPHIKLVEAIDTALSAKLVSEGKRKNIGAVAGTLAAELFGLEIIASSIENNPRNYTRFLVLQREAPSSVTNSNKVSMAFEVEHKPGSLQGVLAALAYNRANLTKIQSVPLVGKAWNYLFFVDFVMENPELYEHIIHVLSGMTENLRIFGRYEHAV